MKIRFLVGNGANEYAKKHNLGKPFDLVHHLVTPTTRNTFEIHSKHVKDYEEKLKNKTNLTKSTKRRKEFHVDDEDDKRYDTIGAVCVDSKNNIAAGSSSGGISLKQPGRVGQVCSYLYVFAIIDSTLCLSCRLVLMVVVVGLMIIVVYQHLVLVKA